MRGCVQDSRLDEPWDMDPRKRDMTTLPSPEGIQLQGLLLYDSEDLGVEYKEWLDLTTDHGRAVLAKAAIAVSNHGGGYIVLGFANRSPLQPSPVPRTLPAVTSDGVNEAVRRYSNPEFQCQTYFVPHPVNSIHYPVIRVPASGVPVMCKRDQGTAELAQYKVYVRKPGPRSEEPHTPEEWRGLLDRCVRARREDMLDSIRSIVLGATQTPEASQDVAGKLEEYCMSSYARWGELVAEQPPDAPCRFPHGFYEVGLCPLGAEASEDLGNLHQRLRKAQEVRLTGWPPFLDLGLEGLSAYASGDYIEAWMARSARNHFRADPSKCEFWRASPQGMLYTLTGYVEDEEKVGDRDPIPNTAFYVELPVWRMTERILFASRLARGFDGATSIAVRCRYTGLSGRHLISIDNPFLVPWKEYRSQDFEITLESHVTLQEIQDNLPELIHRLCKPLYERFNFYQFPLSEVQSIVQQVMRKEPPT